MCMCPCWNEIRGENNKPNFTADKQESTKEDQNMSHEIIPLNLVETLLYHPMLICKASLLRTTLTYTDSPLTHTTFQALSLIHTHIQSLYIHQHFLRDLLQLCDLLL